MQGTVVRFSLDAGGILENYLLLLYSQYRSSGLYCDLHVLRGFQVVFGLHHLFGFGFFFDGEYL